MLGLPHVLLGMWDIQAWKLGQEGLSGGGV